MTSVVEGVHANSDRKVRDLLVVVLAINSGATDAIGFLALGGAFTSVMTGNMVLLGLSAARHDGSAAAHSGLAIVFFIVGCALGTRLAGTARKDQSIWPTAVNRALAVQLALSLTFAISWWAADAHPTGNTGLALLLINAVALGSQSTAVQRFGVPGLSTTYLTGTLTTLVNRLVSGHRLRDVHHHLQLLVGLIGGAALGGTLAIHAPWVAPLLPLACVASVLGVALLVIGRHDSPAPPSTRNN
jgi:uncharacterized membrane protein YoaK (UPF0700 family)